MTVYLFVQVSKSNLDEYLTKYCVLVCRLRNSRIKAKQIAVMEMFMALLPYECIFLTNGPLSTVKGLICFFVPKNNFNSVRDALQKIGYCETFYKINFDEILDRISNKTSNKTSNEIPNVTFNEKNDLSSVENQKWKGRRFSVQKILSQDHNVYESQSPHNREFIISTESGDHKIRGYRGDGSALGRRALPVEDCRCLVNLVNPYSIKTMIDPFAGAGGIIYAARFINSGIKTASIDIDPILAAGLREYGALHYIGDASLITLEGKFDAIITELPFDSGETCTAIEGLKNIYRFLETDGCISIMCSSHQFESIRKFVSDMGMYVYCAGEINRKGTDVAIIAATRNISLADKLYPLVARVATIY